MKATNRRISQLFLLILVIASAYGWTEQIQPQRRGVSEMAPTDGFPLASNDFGWDLLREIVNQRQTAGENGQEKSKSVPSNIFFSPFSISVALSMVYEGARESSAEQLKKALHFDRVESLKSGDRSSISSSVQKVSQRLKQSDQSNAFNTANLLAVDQKFQLNQEYLDVIKSKYEGEVFTGDYENNADELKTRINRFVANVTNGLIDPMLETSPSAQTAMALVNAVYFKGQWKNKFDTSLTEKGVFYASNGQQLPDIQYMKSTDQHHPYIGLDDLDADMLVLNYQGDEVSFVGILPRSRDADLGKIRQAMNTSYLDQKLKRTVSRKKPIVILPRMEITASYDLPDTLKGMGIEDLFSSAANLSGMTSSGSVKVGDVVHRAKIIVNEEGTEAGAGTYVQIALLSAFPPAPPPEFRFDHPFLYFIHHSPSGQILFIGEVHQIPS